MAKYLFLLRSPYEIFNDNKTDNVIRKINLLRNYRDS